MKKFIPIAIFIILAGMMAACVRPASGTTVKLPTQSGQTNPVSTQSALMKEIISGTQTAMAMASSGTQAVMPTPLPGVTSIPGTQSVSFGTSTPVYASPTPRTASATQYPTLTAGPPPIVESTYISGFASNAETLIDIIAVVQNWSVTIQTVSMFPANNTFTVRMGPYGSYAQGGIIVGFTNSGKGGIFKATYQIPDSLRGSDRIHIRMEGENEFWAVNFFDNINYP
jgi:hypothetical protein